jgi:hypothetical protein
VFVVVIDRMDVAVPLATGVTDRGDKLQDIVALIGEIAQVNPTAELKLFTEVTVMVELVELPAVVVADEGIALNEKSGAATTFSVKEALRVWPVPVPLTVAV